MLDLTANHPGQAKDPMEEMSMAPNWRLKQVRELRGWSQARVAEMIGTDATTVSRWERGLFLPTPHFREKLCECFGKNAEELGLLNPITEPHLQDVVGFSRDPSTYERRGLSEQTGPSSDYGEMVALKPRPAPEGVDTFTYILQRSSQEQQAYMLWEHAYVQMLQDQRSEAQRLGQASVSVFEQVRHPNAAVVRAWLGQQGLLSPLPASSTDAPQFSDIQRKRASKPWLRVGGASVLVLLVLVSGVLLSGIITNRPTSYLSKRSASYSPLAFGENNPSSPSNVPKPQPTSPLKVVPPHTALIIHKALANATPLPSSTPLPLPTSTPLPQQTPTQGTTNPSDPSDPAIMPTITPSHLNPQNCNADNQEYRCTVTLAVYTNPVVYTKPNEMFVWQASSIGIPTQFNSSTGMVATGNSFQEIVYIHTTACSPNGTLSFGFHAPSSTRTTTVSATWGC